MENEILLHNESDLRSKIYTIRGVQVMLDKDLAEIYGYSVKAFNQQVKNNIEKFAEDFRFQLTIDECEIIFSRSNFLTLNIGRGTNIKYLPYAFTEQGIYMLMTVLRGELATKQSIALIRLFKNMKDFVFQSQNVLSTPELIKLSLKTEENTQRIAENSHYIAENAGEIQKLKNEMVTKAEVSRVIKDFTDPNIRKDYLFFNGETVEADIAYSTIYSSANQSIFVVDNYISLKTLVLLKSVKSSVKITIYSDNLGNGLHNLEFMDFCKEYPNAHIVLKSTNGTYHDRYIIVDFGTADEKIFHCGGSSKDAGTRTTAISQIEDRILYKKLVSDLQKNPKLVL